MNQQFYYYSEKIKTLIWKDLYTPIFFEAMCIIALIWKQVKGLLESIKKMWSL